MGARMVEKERQRLLKKLERQNREDLLEPIQEKPRASRQSSRTLTRSPSSERARRQQEFEMMRKIQEQAHTKRRWTSLIISGSTWFMLWFVGAAIFEQTEYGQNWSYFGSLYFSYTSLLTIGYGDFYPQSNSGKAFFVFWSLLAVPSLTILISNMGDTIVKGIRDLTLWIGNFTVLPGEKGVKASIKDSANALTKGKLFNDEVHEQPPGILGETDRRRDSTDSEGEEHRKNDPESAAQRAAGDRANQETARAAKQGESNDELPESRAHYHLILAKEIGKVLKHLHSSPPRKYTFDEWAWYLKLIGEDESNAETHRKPKRKPNPDGDGLQTAMKDDDKTVKWSWVGNRSPLMGNKEEAEWVLERLHCTLERELEALRKEELESKGNDGDNEDNEKMTQHRPDVNGMVGGPSIESSRTATEEKDKISA
jgi:potassium channel subfamily K